MNMATLGVAALFLLAACERSAPQRAARSAAPEPARPTSTERPPLRPLTDAERGLAAELRRDVEWLAGEVGERNLDKAWNLDTAADGIARRLETSGHTVQRLGYAVGQSAPSAAPAQQTIGESVVQNLEVRVIGGLKGSEQVVVGAHYDTHSGCPGADDNASGVAAVLALARRLSKHRPSRTLRFVFFVNEEQPYFQTEQMGSLVYAKRLVAEGATIAAMLSIESIGYFSDEPGSQRYPEPLKGKYPSVGDFIAVVANERSRPLLEQVMVPMKRASIPVVGDSMPEELPGVGWSDHWSFWRVDAPALMITDTAPYRYPHYHRASDTADRLDFERMARTVAALEQVVQHLGQVDEPRDKASE